MSKSRTIGEQYFHRWNDFSTSGLDSIFKDQVDRAFSKLRDWQTQSPYSSFNLNIFENFSRLKKSEFAFYLSLGFLTQDSDIRKYCLLILDENRPKGVEFLPLLALRNDLRRLTKYPSDVIWHYLEIEVFPFMSFRRMKGLLSDPYLVKEYKKRVKQITPKRPKKPLRSERIRGYRDHGNLPSDSERARRQANEAGQTRTKIEEFLRREYIANLQSKNFFIRANAFTVYKQSLEHLRQIYGETR